VGALATRDSFAPLLEDRKKLWMKVMSLGLLAPYQGGSESHEEATGHTSWGAALRREW
jgi:hypothetical protein